jgi:hypothetical protein
VARIFISHSAHDGAYALRLKDWLVANGWDEIFLDVDPQRGITAGLKWKEELKRAAHRCELVQRDRDPFRRGR